MIHNVFMSKLILFLLTVSAIGCRAQFSSVGFGSKEVPAVDPKPEIPPPAWPDGPLKVSCAFDLADQSSPIVEAGVVDPKSGKFIARAYNYIKFADEGWISTEITFPGYDEAKYPTEKPMFASVEYYIFLRPDWHTPENFYEVRRVRVGSFNLNQTISQKWKFTPHVLNCRIKSPTAR